MATATFQLASFGDGQCVIEYDVNDANWRVSRIRAINNSPYPVNAIVKDAGIEAYNVTVPANTTQTANTTGLQLGWDQVDGGIIMGSYTFEARWPA